MTSTGPSSPPRLPPELEYSIFLLAFEGDYEEGKTLILVAQRIFEWLIPRIYNVVRLSRERPFPIKFNEAAYQRYGHHVHHLLIEADEYRSHLSLFPNVTNLAFWVTCDPIYLPDLLKLPLTSISIRSSVDLFPVYANVTHLDLVDEFDDFSAIEPYLRLPRLTHVNLLGTLSKGNLEMFLDRVRCPELRVMVLWTWGDCDPVLSEESPPVVGDKRVVIVRCDGSTDWERGARGELDSWRLAEEIIASRE